MRAKLNRFLIYLLNHPETVPDGILTTLTTRPRHLLLTVNGFPLFQNLKCQQEKKNEKMSAATVDRTRDLYIFSLTLSQLSYRSFYVVRATTNIYPVYTHHLLERETCNI